jgi:hypothetical protein
MNIHLVATYSNQNLMSNVLLCRSSYDYIPKNAVEDTDGRMILRDNFDAIFTNIQFNFGEDAGAIGDVNQV